MVKMKFLTLPVFLMTIYCLTIPFVKGAHRASRRSDLADVPPLSQSGYMLPRPCADQSCNETFPGPPKEQTLQYLALARGKNLFSCKGREPTEAPLFELQTTTLWDAAPLLPNLATELAFHSLVPRLLQYDYSVLANSSLICIGSVTTVQSETWVDLVNVGIIPASAQHAVWAQGDSPLNLPWFHLVSYDRSWSIYRVKTYLGVPPSYTCDGLKETFETDYAAEYWFYH